MRRVFRELADDGHLAYLADSQDFSRRAAYFISEINAIHPFREGNGRCQLILLSILMEIAGFEMDETQIQETPFIEAMIASFLGNLPPLERQILHMLRQPQ